MATNKRTIGSDGLEQGGANLGNSIDANNNNTTAGGSEILPKHDEEPANFDKNDEDDEKKDPRKDVEE